MSSCAQFKWLSPLVHRLRAEKRRPIDPHSLTECSSACSWVPGENDVHVCLASGNVHFCGPVCDTDKRATQAGEQVCSLTGQLLSGPAFVFQEDSRAVSEHGHTHVVDLAPSRQALAERKTGIQQLETCVAQFMQLSRAICGRLTSSTERKRLDDQLTVARVSPRVQTYTRAIGRAADDPRRGLAMGVLEAISLALTDRSGDRTMARYRAQHVVDEVSEHFARAVVLCWFRCASSKDFPYSRAAYNFVDHFCAYLFLCREPSQVLVPHWDCLNYVLPRQPDVVTMLLDGRRGMVTRCGEGLWRFLTTTDSTLNYNADPWTTRAGTSTRMPSDKDKFLTAVARLFEGRVDVDKLNQLAK
jgi:hypothetical protein